MKRRSFVQSASTVMAMTAASSRRVLGANDRLRVGLIGCGGRGTLDTRLIRGTPDDIRAMSPQSFQDGKMDPRLEGERNVEVTALCDVWEERLNAAKKWAPTAATYMDFRKLLDDKNVDAVVIASQDHWHVPMAVLACDARKDIYLEKPIMYTVHEAKALRTALKRSNVILQNGTQHHSSEHIIEAARMLKSGKIGRVHFVRIWNYLTMRRPAPVPDAPVPPGLDWDAWLGPAPAVPFNPLRLNYRLFMEYTNGLITDYGMHRFDTAHQIMGVDQPLSVSSSWGHYYPDKAGDLPEIHQATFEYPGLILSYECSTMNSHGVGGRTPGMRYHGAAGPDDRPHGVALYGTEATIFVDRVELDLYPEPILPEGGLRRGYVWKPKMERYFVNEPEPTPLHARNFVESVRARKQPVADLEVGIRSSIPPILGVIAAKVGKKLRWDAATETFPGEKEANALLFRPYRKPWDLVKMS